MHSSRSNIKPSPEGFYISIPIRITMTSNLYTALINLGDILATEASNPQYLSATHAMLDTPTIS